MIDIAYYMQFIDAILSPCNRWDENQRLKNRSNRVPTIFFRKNTFAERENNVKGGGHLERDSYTREMRTKQKANRGYGRWSFTKIRLTGALTSPACRAFQSWGGGVDCNKIQLHWFPAPVML